MQFDVIFTPEALALYWQGFIGTLEILVACLLIGGALSIPLAVLRVSQQAWVRGPIWLFTYIVRGTPLLIQVYLIYYGIAQLDWIQARWDDTWP